MNKFEILIVTLPNRERPVAEMYYNNMYWVQISQEIDDLLIQFYAHPNKKCWEFQIDEALEVIEKAKKKLIG